MSSTHRRETRCVELMRVPKRVPQRIAQAVGVQMAITYRTEVRRLIPTEINVLLGIQELLNLNANVS
jgi:hypothetical protein